MDKNQIHQRKNRKRQASEYIHASGFRVQALGRSGKLRGFPTDVKLRGLKRRKKDWSRKEYFTFHDLRDREHGYGKFQLQRNMRTGIFGINFNASGFNSPVEADDKMISKLMDFIGAYAQAQVTRGHMPQFDLNIINSLVSQYKHKRALYLASIRRTNKRINAKLKKRKSLEVSRKA